MSTGVAMDGVRTSEAGSILQITIDRPPANAIDAAASRALGRAFQRFGDDPALLVAIVTGAGDRFFSAGWDLKAAADGDEAWGEGGFAGLTERFDLDKPVIAAVNGYAAGGGFELALSCDLIVAARSATFFLPEVNLGIVADAGGVLRLPRRLPRALGMELLLTGRRLGAEEAARWGLVNEAVEPTELIASAHELARRIAAAAPLAVRATKAIVEAAEGHSIAEGFELMRRGAIEAYELVETSEDAKEGPAAFVEGREPRWTGR